MPKNSVIKYTFDGTSENSSFFETVSDQRIFVEDIKNATESFINAQEKRRDKSLEVSMVTIF